MLTDVEIMVYPNILVNRKYLNSQKIYDEITVVIAIINKFSRNHISTKIKDFSAIFI